MSLRRGWLVALAAAALWVLAACGGAAPVVSQPAGQAAPTLPVASAVPRPSPSPSVPPSSSTSAGPSASDAAVIDQEDSGAQTGGTTSASPGAVVAVVVGDRLPGEPDPDLTPGALNPAVTQATIHSTICVSGWTATIRPATTFTNGLKVQQIDAYGYADRSVRDYEEDHLISLQLGGAPADPRNLWPEPYTISLADGRSTGARVKDTYETALKRQVCAGTITLASAQERIGIHWAHYYYGIALKLPSPATPSAPAPASGVSPSTAPLPTASPPPASPTRTSSASGSAGSLTVAFVTVPDPAVPGTAATMTVRTRAGAVCAAKVTWPSGRVSTAAGLAATPTAGTDGIASWTWNVGSTTKAGTATAAVTCTASATASASHTFTVA